VADRLAEILSNSAPDHDPERKVYFQRHLHRASPYFWVPFGNAHADERFHQPIRPN
jgi:hypothetical protein